MDYSVQLDSEEGRIEIFDGEEVYLQYDGYNMFKARYEKTDEGTTIHGVQKRVNQERFFISKVLKDVSRWNGVDVDTTCIGAPVLWDISCLQKYRQVSVPKPGTEAKHPIVLGDRKRKRNSETWVKNINKF